MGLAFNKSSFAASLGGIALLAACSGDPLLDHPDLSAQAGDDSVLEEEGVVLGTTWEALSYPTCMYAWSDPDGDGWGWDAIQAATSVADANGSATPGSAMTARSRSTGSPRLSSVGAEAPAVAAPAAGDPVAAATPETDSKSSVSC